MGVCVAMGIEFGCGLRLAGRNECEEPGRLGRRAGRYGNSEGEAMEVLEETKCLGKVLEW